MPPEVEHDFFHCDLSCSDLNETDINDYSWFSHVLPQLRGRYLVLKLFIMFLVKLYMAENFMDLN